MYYNKSKIAILLLVLFMLQSISLKCVYSKEDDGRDFIAAGHEYDNINLEEQYKEKITTIALKSTKAFTDINDEGLKNIAGFLNVSKIMLGYDGNTFRPQEAVTRGDFAKVLLRVINIDPYELKASLNGELYDIKPDDELYPVINAVVSLGIVDGFKDNTFKPQNPVSYEEAIVMLTRALGYEDIAKANGGYPTGYFHAAQQSGLIAGFKPTKAAALSRDDVARLSFRALDTPLLKAVAFGDDTEYSISNDTTSLTLYHKIYNSTGMVNSTHVTSIRDRKVNDEEILIDDDLFNVDNNEFDLFLGYKVNYFYYSDQDEKKVIYMSKYKSVDEKIILADDIIGIQEGVLSYFNKENKKTDVKIAELHNIILNGKHISKYDEDIYDIEEGTIKLVSNDGDSEYEVVLIDCYDNIVLSSKSSDGSKIVLTPKYNLQAIEKEVNDKKTVLDIIGSTGEKIDYNVSIAGVYDRDGNLVKTVDLSQIPNDAVVSVFADDYIEQRGHKLPSKNSTYIILKISDNKVTGTLEAINQNEGIYTINGRDYKVSKSNFLEENDSEVSIGDTGDFYLDIIGKIVYFSKNNESDNSEYKYGYLINTGIGIGIDPIFEVKVLTVNNTVEIFQCTKTVRVNDDKMEPSIIKEYLETKARLLNVGRTDISFTISQVIKYKINDKNQITDIQTVLDSVGESEDHLCRAELPRKYSVVEDTYGRLRSSIDNKLSPYLQPQIYFKVPSIETFYDDDLYETKIIGMKDLYDDQVIELYDVSIYKKPKVAVMYSNVASAEGIPTAYQDYAAPVMVKSVVKALDNDGVGRSKIKVAAGFDEREFYGEESNTFDGLKPGEVIKLFGKNKIVSKYEHCTFDGQIIASESIGNIDKFQKDSTSYFYYFGEVYYVKGNDFVVQAGPIIDVNTGKRETQWVTTFLNNPAIMSGGVLLYDDTISKSKPDIGSAKATDLKSVYSNGAAEASKVYLRLGHGQPTCFVIYNLAQ